MSHRTEVAASDTAALPAAVAGDNNFAVAPTPSSTRPRPMSQRLRDWLRTLHHDPTAEERAMQERRERLLAELARRAAEEPDDVPLFEKMERLNHHDND